jgi:hypothetical protein
VRKNKPEHAYYIVEVTFLSWHEEVYKKKVLCVCMYMF